MHMMKPAHKMVAKSKPHRAPVPKASHKRGRPSAASQKQEGRVKGKLKGPY